MKTARTTPRAAVDVMLVEDHLLLAESLQLLLSARGLTVKRCRDMSAGAVIDSVARTAPRVVLLDVDLGSDYGSSIPIIATLSAHATVVMLTAVTDPIVLAACIEAGASGTLDKARPADELLDAVSRVLDGQHLLARDHRTEMLITLDRHRRTRRKQLAPFSKLTATEADVLVALSNGLSAEQIAEQRYVSITTIRSHIRALLRKLGVASQLAAVALAQRSGWVHDLSCRDCAAATSQRLLGAADSLQRQAGIPQS